MKKIIMLFAIMIVFCSAAAVPAVDLAALDRVSISMPRAKVLTLLGAPDETVALAKELKAEVYHVASAPPLMHSGCIYDREGKLVGQSFVFKGHTAVQIITRLQHYGFVQMPKEGQAHRFAGVDDDTGQPLVAVVAESDHLTTITTFEKTFYDAHAGQLAK